MSSAKIFGLVREIVTVAGIPLYKKNSLTAAERIWLQENTEAEENRFNTGYYEFIRTVQADAGIETEAKSYHFVKQYYRGELEDKELADRIELLSLRNPLPKRDKVAVDQLTYLIDSRIVKSQFPRAEFLEAFGIEYDNEWTSAHSEAAQEILGELETFFEGELNRTNKSDDAGGKKEPAKKS